jgi:hypothetical protein
MGYDAPRCTIYSKLLLHILLLGTDIHTTLFLNAVSPQGMFFPQSGTYIFGGRTKQ